MEEKDILSKAKSGDELSMEQLFNDYKPLVTIISRKYFLQGGELSDLIQEGMIGLYKAVHSYDFEKTVPFKKYARTCIERNIINAVKKGSSLKNAPFNDLAISLNAQGQSTNEDEDIGFTLISSEDSPEGKILGNEKARYIMKTIRKQLSSYELNVLRLYMKGYTYIDISEKLDKPAKSIDNALKRIKTKLSYLKKGKEEK